MGYNMMLFASDVQRAAIFAMRRLLERLKTERTTEFFDDMVSFQDREAIVKTDHYLQLQARYMQVDA
jgi:2-methylisocitrate lyase-like PEP mutase family enzyme